MFAAWLAALALAICFPSVRGAPSASAYLKAGDAAVSRSEWTSAVRHYTAAIDVDDGAVLAYTKRAAAHSGLGDHRAALRDLSAALELDDSVLIRLQRGKLRKSLCDFGGAETDFRAVLASRPAHRTAERELDSCSRGMQALEAARIGREASDVAATRAQLATLFELAERCSEAKLMEAALLAADRDHSGVVAITGQVLKAEPSNREALLLRSRSYLLMADIDMAKRHLGELLKHDPDDAEALRHFKSAKKLQKAQQKGDAALRRREWGEAVAAYIEALWVDRAADAINAIVWLGLCKAQLELKDKEEALKSCNAAADMRREQPEPCVLKVRALLLSEQWDAAIAEARAARDAHRQDQSIHQVLIEAEKAKKMAERKDYYAILSIVKDASTRDVKQAYRHLARRLHPDKAMADGVPKEEAETKFHNLAEAYEVLSDEEKRGRYDRGEDVEVQQQQGHPFQHFQHFQHFGGGGQQYHFNFG